MQAGQWQEIERAFHEALAKTPTERPAFLAGLAPGTREAVERFLLAHATPHPWLDAPLAREMPAGTPLGPYELLRPIGVGGMGVVYLARRADGQYHKQVAIKLTHQGAFDLGGRFERERQILAQLEHPHIARLLDAGVSPQGQPYLVMDLAEGVTLDRWAAEQRPGLKARLDLFEKIAEAAGYAHRHLVVHRDLKPANILVSAGGEPKLVDFGIAKELDGNNVTQTLNLTPKYASPEQIQGGPVTTASDIYGLGLILYELVAGRHPFPDAGLTATRQLQFPHDVPRDLAAVIGRALREEPGRRYATVEQFVEDLRRYRHGRPVIAQPESKLYRMRKFISRHRWPVAAAAVAILALIAATLVAVVSARRAQRELARANKVSQFMSGIMGVVPSNAPSSLRSKGASLKVVDLVDSVTASLEREFGEVHPEAEATIRYMAGSVYNQMGLYAKAKPLAARSVQLFAAQRAPDDPERIAAVILLGGVHVYLGEFAPAERLLTETRQRWGSPAPYTVAGLESYLGIAQLRLGRRDAARSTFEHCVQVIDGLGEANPWGGLVLSNLSLVYQESGEWERARETLEKAMRKARTQRDAAPEAVGWAALNLAVVDRVLDQPQAARAAAIEAIEAFRLALGPDSAPEAQGLAQLAWAQIRLQDAAAAENTARRAHAIQLARLAPGHLEEAVGLTWLGFVLLEKGKLAEARPLLERAVAIRREKAPQIDWRTVPAALFLAELLAKQGDVERGRAMLNESVEQLAKLFGAENLRVKDAQRRLARLP